MIEFMLNWLLLDHAGVGSSAAYKKWEKAAIAGVSLVADAAEHLERTMVKEVEEDRNAAGGTFCSMAIFRENSQYTLGI